LHSIASSGDYAHIIDPFGIRRWITLEARAESNMDPGLRRDDGQRQAGMVPSWGLAVLGADLPMRDVGWTRGPASGVVAV
jgi:hypothetical protein